VEHFRYFKSYKHCVCFHAVMYSISQMFRSLPAVRRGFYPQWTLSGSKFVYLTVEFVQFIIVPLHNQNQFTHLASYNFNLLTLSWSLRNPRRRADSACGFIVRPSVLPARRFAAPARQNAISWRAWTESNNPTYGVYS